MEKIEYLEELYHKYEDDFQVFILSKDFKSKWIRYSKARTKPAFLQRVNNRQILETEIVLDIENPDEYPKIKNLLRDQGYQFKAFKTGSRGYHIHLIFPELKRLDKIEREKIRECFIEAFGGDISKKSDRAGIAVEYCPHWKTGNPKEVDIMTEGWDINKIEKIITKLDEKEKIEKEIKESTKQKTSVDNIDVTADGKTLKAFRNNDTGRIFPLEFFDEKMRLIHQSVADYLLLNYKFVTTGINKFTVFYYDRGAYSLGGERFIKRKIEELTFGNATAYDVNEIINHIQNRTFVDEEEVNNLHPNELVVDNGIFNFKTGKLTPHDPKKIFFNRMPVEYNPKAVPKKFLRFLFGIMSPKDIITFIEFLGSCLLRDYRYKKMLIIQGDADMGKSTLFRVIKDVFGERNCANTPIQDLAEGGFCILSLYKKMLNVVDDLSKDDICQVSFLKQLTGGFTIGCDVKFKEYFSFTNYAKIICTANEIPPVHRDYAHDVAYYRRWLVILLKRREKFVEIKEFHKKLTTKKELSGILNLAHLGLKLLEQNNDFHHDMSPEDTQRFMHYHSSSISKFVVDCLSEGADEDFITKEEMHNRYTAFCKKRKIRMPYPKKKFGMEILSGQYCDFMKDGQRNETVEGRRTHFEVWRNVKFEEKSTPQIVIEEERKTPKFPENGWSLYKNSMTQLTQLFSSPYRIRKKKFHLMNRILKKMGVIYENFAIGGGCDKIAVLAVSKNLKFHKLPSDENTATVTKKSLLLPEGTENGEPKVQKNITTEAEPESYFNGVISQVLDAKITNRPDLVSFLKDEALSDRIIELMSRNGLIMKTSSGLSPISWVMVENI